MGSQTEVYEQTFQEYQKFFEEHDHNLLHASILALGGGLQRSHEFTF